GHLERDRARRVAARLADPVPAIRDGALIELARTLFRSDRPEDDLVVRLEGTIAVAMAGDEIAGAKVGRPDSVVALDRIDGALTLHRDEVGGPGREDERGKHQDHESPDTTHRRTLRAAKARSGLCTPQTAAQAFGGSAGSWPGVSSGRRPGRVVPSSGSTGSASGSGSSVCGRPGSV